MFTKLVLVKLWRNQNPCALVVRMKNGAAAKEISIVVSQKENLKLELPYHLAILLLGIYSKEFKGRTQTVICTPMLIPALLTIAKMWKQPKCLSVDKGINTMWYMRALEYFSAFKTYGILVHVRTYMSLEKVRPTETSQLAKDTYCIILLTWDM